MRYIEVGGERLSVVGLGTWQFGSREWAYGPHYAEHDANDIANRALDLGVNLVDTAEVYGFGRSEEIVGRVLAGRRPEVFVATKLFPLLPTPAVISWRAKGSLRRLGIEAIDLYQIHQPNPVVPLGWQMAGMRELMANGSVRRAGVSNFSLARWQAAEGALGGAVFSNQVRFNLVDRHSTLDLLPWAQRHDRLVIAYSPLAQGLLSARYDPDHRPGGMRASLAAFLPENLERARPLMNELREVAKSHDATPAQVALAWVTRHPNVVVIPGASTVAQVEANAEAAELDLSDEEASQLLAAAETYEPVGGAAAFGRVVGERAKALFTR